MTPRIHTYEGDGLIVEYDRIRCIHAAECVRGLPDVFDPQKRPWIDPSQARSEAVADVVRRCPTGALRYSVKRDGVEQERPAPDNTVTVAPDGPLYVAGELRLALADGNTATETRLALCRCGASSNKPLCDGSHSEAGFADPGIGTAPKSDRDSEVDPAAPLKLIPLLNGPMRLEGCATVVDARGESHPIAKAALCRCGHSKKKPFCDGSHTDVGFVAP